MSILVGSGLWLAVGGLALHVILLLSVFDIYFRSPVVPGVCPYQPQHESAARRLVLISVDGLRAESLLEHSRTPYLRSVAEHRGLWGISNTRVPTESRPGHVAIAAGFYEDPSAVAKGWKENPVNFDSVFNQSRYTWAWGEEDIMHIFSKGTNDGNVFIDSYIASSVSYGNDRNTTLLDGWVFEQVKLFLNNATSNADLTDKLHRDKIVFFLHLLGMDTSGHTNQPDSPEFLINLKYVDEGIAEIEKVFENFYQHDGQTTYIMTSDHGMTNWGSHGAGGRHETETPYIIWGAGVAQSVPGAGEGSVFGLPASRRRDINQADLAPLMSAVLSIPVPVNSIGQLPAELLNLTQADRAKAVYSNSRQLAAQYDTMRELVERDALPPLYDPYLPLTKRRYKEVIAEAETLLAEGAFDKLIILSQQITHLSLSGLTYYYNYYQNVLLLFISLSFVGWICYLLTILLNQMRSTSADIDKSQCSKGPMKYIQTNILFGLLFIILGLLIIVQRLPVQYNLYCLVPVVLWWRVACSAGVWVLTFRDIVRSRSFLKITLQVVCYVVGTVCLVSSFEQRWWLVIPLVGMAAWPLLSTESKRISWTLAVCWAGSCILLGVFSFLPVVGREVHIPLVILAGVIWLLVSAVYVRECLLPMCASGLESKKEVVVAGVQAGLLAMALHNIYIQSRRFALGSSVLVGYQVAAWLIAMAALMIPLLSSTRLVCRISAIGSSLLTIYLLLSVAHEGLFLVTLVLNQACWLLLESQLSCSSHSQFMELTFTSRDSNKQRQGTLLTVERSLTGSDFRRAFFFLLYMILSFFGTGNIASINSFEVRWVTCFITTFRPFVITGLILFKTFVPFLVVGCTFRAISIVTKITMSKETQQSIVFRRGRNNSTESKSSNGSDLEGLEGASSYDPAVVQHVVLQMAPPRLCRYRRARCQLKTNQMQYSTPSPPAEQLAAETSVPTSLTDAPSPDTNVIRSTISHVIESDAIRKKEPTEATFDDNGDGIEMPKDLRRGEVERHVLWKAPKGHLILIVMIFSDMMGMQLLHYVRNTGSWLEIGTSISHYVIAQVITLFIVLLNGLAKVLSEINVSRFAMKVYKSGKKLV